MNKNTSNNDDEKTIMEAYLLLVEWDLLNSKLCDIHVDAMVASARIKTCHYTV